MSYQVGNYFFETEEEAKEAQKEAQAVEYIKKQVDMTKPEVVLATYRQLIEKEVFHTKLGIAFLQEMQQVLETSGVLRTGKMEEKKQTSNDDAVSSVEEPRTKRKTSRKKKALMHELGKYKRRSFVLSIICITLTIIIIGMFVITATSSSPTIFNYEQKLIDKYATWEQDLDRREKEIRQREQK